MLAAAIQPVETIKPIAMPTRARDLPLMDTPPSPWTDEPYRHPTRTAIRSPTDPEPRSVTRRHAFSTPASSGPHPLAARLVRPPSECRFDPERPHGTLHQPVHRGLRLP